MFDYRRKLKKEKENPNAKSTALDPVSLTDNSLVIEVWLVLLLGPFKDRLPKMSSPRATASASLSMLISLGSKLSPVLANPKLAMRTSMESHWVNLLFFF